MALLTHQPRALLFDVFGTCVDWRSTVTRALNGACQSSLDNPSVPMASDVRTNASGMTEEKWSQFAQEWRNTYMQFTMSIASNKALPWKTVDEHHLDSLGELLVKWNLDGLWRPHEVQTISLIWHRLDPWSDSENGIKALNSKCQTCTLSNGNLGLLNDLKTHAKLEFTHLFSAEQFGTYKPSPAIYLGAVEKLGLTPMDCAMVAAHLGDLKAAKSCGLQTIYVERPREEDFDAAQVEAAREDGYVDLWVTESEDGFLAVAKKLGM